MAKQSDGRYRAKVTVGKDMNGGSVVKYVSGRTKKDLEAAKEAVKQEIHNRQEYAGKCRFRGECRAMV